MPPTSTSPTASSCRYLLAFQGRVPPSQSSTWGSPHPLALPQIDFPTSAFEVKFTNPPAAEFSPRYEFGSLGEEDQRQLREAMQKKSLYW